MAVDLFDLVDPLKREVNPPGSDVFPGATDDDWFGSLTDSFWEVRLYGMLEGWEENAAARGGPPQFTEGKITPVGAADDYDAPTGYSTEDLGRDLQQLIVVWAGYKIVLARMGSLNTLFRAQAGPVQYETQQAASVLKGLLDTLKARIDEIIRNMSTWGSGTKVAALDAMVERSYSQAMHETWWVR
jgi:hypothetical protein